jgi:hypothetical protein
VAVFIYSNPPRDLSNLPFVESVKTLLCYFEVATKARGASTILYEDPDISNKVDMELLKELNLRVQQNPDYSIPEGFVKVT